MTYPSSTLAKTPFGEVRVRWRFLSASVKQDPHAATYLPGVAAFAATWSAADQMHKSLEDALADAEAGAVYNDRQLDALADDIWFAIYGAAKAPVATPLGKLFFGSSTLAQFKDPVLAAELKGASAWPGHLGQATLPALLALAPKGATVVAAAEGAATALATAISNLDGFTKGGGLQATYDAFNGLCATVHAGLKTFALANQGLKLGTTYADTFFMHTPRSSQPTTVTGAAELIAQLEHKLGVATKTHTDLVTKATVKTAAIAAHDQAVTDAATKKKAADLLVKEAAAAKAAAKKLKPKKK